MSIGLPELIILFWGAVLLAFWIWMIIDCANNEPSGTEKLVWILIILLASFIGAAIYYFVRRPIRLRETSG